MNSKLFSALFNFPPWPGAMFLQDLRGRKYWYGHEDTTPEIILFVYKGLPVAHIKLFWENVRLEILDIAIYDSMRRENGLGARMFDLVKKIARNENIKLVHGIIHPETPADKVRLERFYRNQGCRVEKTWFVLYLT